MLYVYMGVVILYLLSVVGAELHGIEQGRKLERADSMQQEKERGEEINAGVKKIVQHVQAENDAARANLIIALGKREKDYEKINDQFNTLAANHERLRVKTSRTATCNKPVPGKDPGSSLPDGTVEVELSAETTRRLRAIARDADYEGANCNALRDIISPVIEIVGYRDDE